MIKISLVVPVYNTELFLNRCIDSCVNQDIDLRDYEIIVVNDGSTDNSQTILERLKDSIKNLIVINQANLGLSGARNTGLRHAQGEYIWFVDSDDWIKTNCLQRVTELCIKEDLDVLQFCAANIIDGSPERRFHRRDVGKVIEGKELIKNRIPFCAPFSIYKRTFLLNNNLCFYEGVFHEDNEFTPRVCYLANRIMAIDDVLYFVFLNPNSITRTVNPKKSLDCIVVMNQLDKFWKIVDDDNKRNFSDIITATMNVAFFDALNLDQNGKTEFTRSLNSNKYLIKHLFRSSSLVYRIEGLLLWLFPRHTIKVYAFLNLLDKRKIKGKEV
jgi:glycosyltransferase involved in cell wall biosynthesis